MEKQQKNDDADTSEAETMGFLGRTPSLGHAFE
jgi:hypothetical protein